MFGYVIPDKQNMYVKDFSSFRAYYCGLCKALGKTGSPLTRFCTNYDTAFYNVLLHTLADVDVKYENKPCVLHPLVKRSNVVVDDITLKVADVSVLLVYYNAVDDVEDGKKSRLFIKLRLAARKRAAANRLKDVDDMMKFQFGRLSKLEKAKSTNIDEVADCTAALMRDMTRSLVGIEDENVDTFAYNLGKLVYLMDAVDDVEEDSLKHRYNPVTAKYGECADKKAYLIAHADDLKFLLESSYDEMVEAYDKMNVRVGEGVLSNTVYLGVKLQINKLLKGEEKCQTTRL